MLTRYGLYLLLAHSSSFLIMVAMQHYGFHSLFSWSNYYREEEFIDWPKAIEMVVLAPFREELVFRASLFCIFYQRLGDESASSKIHCALLSSAAFGCVHLLNVFSTKYELAYVLVQVTMGCVIGFQYILMFLLNQSLLETLLLHIANNVLSSFLPFDVAFDFSNMYLTLPLCQTIIIFSYFIGVSLDRVRDEQDKIPFALTSNILISSQVPGPPPPPTTIKPGKATPGPTNASLVSSSSESEVDDSSD